MSTSKHKLHLPSKLFGVSDFFKIDHSISGVGGARGVVVIVVGNGHGDTSSNPGRDLLHFT